MNKEFGAEPRMPDLFTMSIVIVYAPVWCVRPYASVPTTAGCTFTTTDAQNANPVQLVPYDPPQKSHDLLSSARPVEGIRPRARAATAIRRFTMSPGRSGSIQRLGWQLTCPVLDAVPLCQPSMQ